MTVKSKLSWFLVILGFVLGISIIGRGIILLNVYPLMPTTDPVTSYMYSHAVHDIGTGFIAIFLAILIAILSGILGDKLIEN